MAKNKMFRLRLDNDIDSQIDARVLQCVKARSKLTWRQMAEIMQVTKSHVSHVKNGDKGLTLKRYVKLARGLNMDLPTLFGQVTQAQPVPKKAKKGDDLLRGTLELSSKIGKIESEME